MLVCSVFLEEFFVNTFIGLTCIFFSRPRVHAQRKFAQGSQPSAPVTRDDSVLSCLPFSHDNHYNGNGGNGLQRERSLSLDGQGQFSHARPAIHSDIVQPKNPYDAAFSCSKPQFDIGIDRNRCNNGNATGCCNPCNSISDINDFFLNSSTNNSDNLFDLNYINNHQSCDYEARPSSCALSSSDSDIAIQPKTEDFLTFLCFRGKLVIII